MEEKPTYKKLIDIGFERFEGDDKVWFNKYGYEWFWLELKLTKRISVFWCPEDKVLELRRSNKKNDILATHVLGDMNELKKWIKFFKNKQ